MFMIFVSFASLLLVSEFCKLYGSLCDTFAPCELTSVVRFYIYFALVPFVLSFHLFLRSRLLDRAFDLHMIGVEPFLPIF